MKKLGKDIASLRSKFDQFNQTLENKIVTTYFRKYKNIRFSLYNSEDSLE